MCKNGRQIICNCSSHIFLLFLSNCIIYHSFQHNFILVFPKIFKLYTHLDFVLLFVVFVFTFVFWYFVPTSLTYSWFLNTCPSLLLLLYNFFDLIDQKSRFPFALSALNYWSSLCRILDSTPVGRQCPSEKPRPSEEIRKSGTQVQMTGGS